MQTRIQVAIYNRMMAIQLTNRVLVVAGASSGIGRATAVHAAKAGMHVVLAGRRVKLLEEVAEEVRAAQRQALVIVCDVNSDTQVQQMIDRSAGHFGRLDAVFANAGYGLYATVLETSEAQYRAIFETNVYGTLRVLKAAAAVMLEQENHASAGRGHLLICTSAASEVSPPMYGAYAATKAAQDALGQSLRAELAEDRIYVSTVHPIPTKTEFFDRLRENAAPGRVVVHTPVPFEQTVDQVAAAIIRGLRKPIPEIWPHKLTRFGAAFATAFPSPANAALRHHMKKLRRIEAAQKPPT